MRKPPKLSEEQKKKLSILEPELRASAKIGDFKQANIIAKDIQDVLRPTGHETRLMQAKNWLFEAAMEAGRLQIAIAGFSGIRDKTSARTRVHLEATALLAICFLRQQDTKSAEPLIAFVLKNNDCIKSDRRRRQFRKNVIQRFEEEAVLSSLKNKGADDLIADDIHAEAGNLIQTKTNNDIYSFIGSNLPQETIDLLLNIDRFSKNQLPAPERLYLPPPAEIVKPDKLGNTVFSSLKRVLWRSLCDPKSDVYKAWYHEGVAVVLNKKYIATAIAASLSGLSIGIKALAVSAVALIIKMGLEIFCEVYKPNGIMIALDE